MGLEGSFEDFDITDIFQLIHLGAKDGALHMSDDEGVGIIYFKGGLVTHATAVDKRGKNAIQKILRWSKTRFEFKPKELAPEKTIELPIQQVILEAARQIDEWKRIEKLISSIDVVVEIITELDEGIENIKLQPEEWKVLTFVNGKTTIKEIAQKTRLSEFDTSKIIFGLTSSGLVKIQKPKGVKKEEVPGGIEKLLKKLRPGG